MHSLQRANPFTDFGERLAAIGEARGKATSRGLRLERSESPNSRHWLGAGLIEALDMRDRPLGWRLVRLLLLRPK